MPDGFLSNTRPWLWASDVFVMPSRAEGFSIALLEGMASELPVIASDIEPFMEIVKDGSNGLIAKKDAPDDFARAMGLMLDMGPEGRLRIVQSARTVLERDFTPETAAEKTLVIYRDILDAGN
jgi:glycosyltransferase involved in cell wall biosynthesis